MGGLENPCIDTPSITFTQESSGCNQNALIKIRRKILINLGESQLLQNYPSVDKKQTEKQFSYNAQQTQNTDGWDRR